MDYQEKLKILARASEKSLYFFMLDYARNEGSTKGRQLLFLEDEFRKHLDEIHPPIQIFGMPYYVSNIWEKIDAVAYVNALFDYQSFLESESTKIVVIETENRATTIIVDRKELDEFLTINREG